jgi:hypothetical protein
MKCVDFLEKLEEKSTVAEARKYLDIKEGLKLSQILQAPSNTAFSKDWINWLNNIRTIAIQKISTICVNDEVCRNDKDCDCIITTGLGDKILEAVIKLIEEETKDQPTELKIAEMVDPLLRKEWENIGEIITAWCCGASRMSTALE